MRTARFNFFDIIPQFALGLAMEKDRVFNKSQADIFPVALITAIMSLFGIAKNEVSYDQQEKKTARAAMGRNAALEGLNT